MATQTNTGQGATGIIPPAIKSAIPLTALELNSYKLDVKHTILTPEYLEQLTKSKTDKKDP